MIKKFTSATKAKEIKREWHLIDLKDQVLGRTATTIASLLIGKTKSYFTTNLDCGDNIVVINARLVKVTGKKSSQKIYMSYSGYPGGEKRKTFENVLKEDPKRIIFQAVSGMLPKNKLRDSMLKRLYIFADDKHPYQDKFEARNPKS